MDFEQIYAHHAREYDQLVNAEDCDGRLVCLQRGVYSDVPIATMSHGKKRVNVAELYDAANYRPRIRHVLGMPMFLT